MNTKNNDQQPLQGNSGEQDLTKNPTLNDPGASVADYGRSGTGLDNSGRDQSAQPSQKESDRSDHSGTMGNP
ncbi:MAG TPA: hypothetical protein VHK91_16220 [Flavisolibacter sp.]|jgi:hypothetical protein|nr:hypothetical protein [Flavisolibacter sp.]